MTEDRVRSKEGSLENTTVSWTIKLTVTLKQPLNTQIHI